VRRFCEEPKGLILVTGPTGSGKSTTLAAMVDLLNKTRRDHIITLEDPIEFVHPSQNALVNQREVGAHTQSFARALRAALREDPDIVLVGEMRDLETISMALETANTGHLVLGTLHTSTAVMTVDRIVNLFPAEQQNQIRSTLADVLRGVICQNLLRRIGGGRVAALEILVVNPAVAALIREGKTIQIPNIMQTAKAQGNQLLNDSLVNLVQTQKVEYEEALSKAVDKADIAKRLKRTP
jgi:twitching motility protein PilT